jgi:DNA repair protein RecO (recombination protein O)
MFTHYRTQGVILKKSGRGEADQFLVAYTKEFGRVEIVAKSVRKIASKLRPAVEFPAIVELEFIQGKTCKTLTDAVILIPLKQARRDARRWEAMNRFAGLAEALIKDQQEDPAVWELVRAAMIALDAAGSKNQGSVYHHYVWHLFTLLGWRPGFGQSSADVASRSLVDFFRDSEIDRSSKMRLTERQNAALEEVIRNYLQFVTK